MLINGKLVIDKGSLKIKITDTYDYEHWEYNRMEFLKVLINNVAYDCYFNEVIVSYDIEVNLNYYYEE